MFKVHIISLMKTWFAVSSALRMSLQEVVMYINDGTKLHLYNIMFIEGNTSGG